jgi:hypothetical protein
MVGWLLVAVVLLTHLNAIAGNPWGLSVDDGSRPLAADPERRPDYGRPSRDAAESEASVDDTIGGVMESWSARPRGAVGRPGPWGYQPREPVPASGGDWQGRDAPAVAAPRGDAFRSGSGGAGYLGGTYHGDDADDLGGADYRYRGDPPGRAGVAVPRDSEGYRFRPLSEQERGRQEQARGWRPVVPGTAQGQPPPSWPWSPPLPPR